MSKMLQGLVVVGDGWFGNNGCGGENLDDLPKGLSFDD